MVRHTDDNDKKPRARQDERSPRPFKSSGPRKSGDGTRSFGDKPRGPREDGAKRFGDKAYAFEELVAEQVSARICYELGLPADLHESHASYIAHWLDILKSDKTAIITAAAKAA